MSHGLFALDALLASLKAAPDARYEDYKAFGTVIQTLPAPEERTQWCEAAIACHPRSENAYLGIADAWSHAGMGTRARFLGNTRIGIGLLERALKAATPGDKRHQIHTNLSFLYNEIDRHDLAEKHGRLAHGNTNFTYQLWLSEALFAQGKFGSDPLCCIDTRVFERNAMQALADEVTQRWNAAPPAPTDDFTLLVSVDSVYFRKFALAQAINLHRLGSQVRVHYHIINPDSTIPALVTALQERVPGLKLGFSYVKGVDLGASNNVYYACARLLVARTLMERYNSNIVITDADVLFRVRPETLLADTAGHDLGTIKYLGEPMCNRYNASFFAIRRTLPGTYFLRVMEEFLQTTFERGLLWMIDQIALYYCEQRVAAVTRGGLKTLHWPESVVAIHHYPLSSLWEDHPDAPIWSGATLAKWRDTHYTRYRNELLRDAGFDPTGL
ncbi:hypothetical protein M2352_005170 [Azospirillum fermentarium]|uniref:hypothetical protein n=1 Tax=Azospirillum fermentarium TaxID=1233114 RepID=UPI002225D337|nr:hypothetical protein [Azospirillum fermentarium]MCW2249487.1 hypothetical protein [Azospirillum fermentarium]